ncbi:hypothetical protein KAU51_00115 [Candidatus Parcubacteria bacterium]|nr:hypothetical protein [Candidatus Parcubacteria bacterium]
MRRDRWEGDERSTNGTVYVDFGNGQYIELIQGKMAKRFDHFSRDERNKVIADVEKQIDDLGPGNCPPVYRHLLYELKHGKPPK